MTATRFVAGFLGASNLLRGRAEGVEGERSVVRLDSGSVVRVPTVRLAGRTRVDLGVRPEKIRMLETADPLPAGSNTLSGQVRSALYTGVSTQYQVELPDGALVVVYEQNIERARAATQWQPGEAAVLSWSPEDTFAVDPPASSDASDAEMLGMATPTTPPT
jgi:spermidine/putrescine transport system ATP-binding protein